MVPSASSISPCTVTIAPDCLCHPAKEVPSYSTVILMFFMERKISLVHCFFKNSYLLVIFPKNNNITLQKTHLASLLHALKSLKSPEPGNSLQSSRHLERKRDRYRTGQPRLILRSHHRKHPQQPRRVILQNKKMKTGKPAGSL